MTRARTPLLIILNVLLGGLVLAVVTNLIAQLVALPPLAVLLVGAVALLALIAVNLALSRQPAASPDPLRRVTVPELLARIGRGAEVVYVDRGATTVDLLRHHRRIAITGRMKLGKTREAIQLLRRAIADDLVAESALYEPAPGLALLSTGSLPSLLAPLLDPHASAFLLLDDLPYHFAGSALDCLTELLQAMQRCKACTVVVTARTDQLDASPEHGAWLERHAFHLVPLPDLDPDQTGRLIDNAAETFRVQVRPGSRDTLVAGRDGTPEQIVAGLRRFEGQELDPDGARTLLARSPADQWADLRAFIAAYPRLPGGGPLLESLAAFHAARVTAYTSLALAYAARLWRRHDPPRRPWPARRALAATLRALAPYGIVAQDGQVRAPDVAVEALVEPAAARAALETFLTRHRRAFHRRALRRLYPDATAHMWALFDLALEAQNRGDPSSAVRLYTVALRVRPHPFAYNNRGLARAEEGDRPAAIQDYTRAIELDPTGAAAYNNRGLARAAEGDRPAAIEDYTRAIELFPDGPDKAKAYHNRGLARAAEGDRPARRGGASCPPS